MLRRFVIGIDEVGRGALAGPVVVAAAMVESNTRFSDSHPLGILKDSKKLTAKKREAWYGHFLAHPKITFAVARVYPRQIEKRNVSGAANLAALRVYKKLTVSHMSPVLKNCKIFLDGGLFLGNKSQRMGQEYKQAKTVIKGDEKIPAIAIASIIAKVHRDRFMKKMAKKHPNYGFDIHKGYGTKKHRAALQKYGPSAIHRLTFLQNSAKV